MVEALLRQMSRRADLSDFDSPFTRYGGRSSNTLLIRNNPATGKEASEVFADLNGQDMPSFMARFCRTFSIKRARSCHFVTDRLGLGALPICEKYRGSCLCIIEFRRFLPCAMNGRLRSDGPSISEPVEVKQLVAKLTLDKTMPQSVLSKKCEALTAWSDRRASREPLSNQNIPSSLSPSGLLLFDRPMCDRT
jgi:hypothetical protein